MMGDELLLSIVVLDVKDHYLIPITLESIFNQTEKRFEVLVLTQSISPQELNRLKRYVNKLSIDEIDPEVKTSMIKNIAFKKVKGKYVHFLFPGEYYLSKFSLSYAFENMEKERFPDIVSFTHLLRDLLSPPKIFYPSFSESFLATKYYPLITRNIFFLRKTVEEMGGFDTRYSGLQGFDLITKIFLKDKYKFLSLKRVIVDYELQKDDPQKVLRYISDLIFIIYRNYGLKAIFSGAVIKELVEFTKSYLKGLKRFFVRGD